MTLVWRWVTRSQWHHQWHNVIVIPITKNFVAKKKLKAKRIDFYFKHDNQQYYALCYWTSFPHVLETIMETLGDKYVRTCMTEFYEPNLLTWCSETDIFASVSGGWRERSWFEIFGPHRLVNISSCDLGKVQYNVSTLLNVELLNSKSFHSSIIPLPPTHS